MESDLYYIAAATAFVYVVFRIIQIEWIDHEKHDKLIKKLTKEMMLVFASCVFGIYLLIQVKPHYENITSAPDFVFTDTPDF